MIDFINCVMQLLILLKICHCVLYSIVYLVAMYVIGNITLYDNDSYKMVLDWIILFLL